MKKMKIIGFLLMFMSIVTLVGCKKNNDKNIETRIYPKTNEASKVVYVVNGQAMNSIELEMVASLQGIVAQQTPSIFINDDEESEAWINEYKTKYNLRLVNVDNAWDLVDTFKQYITDNKYVVYTSTHETNAPAFDQSINYATVVASCDNYLMISSSLETLAQNHGLSKGKDVRDETTTTIFNAYKNSLNKNVLVHQNPEKWQLRDYAIAVRAMTFYSDYYDGNENIRNEIYEWSNDNIPVLGWTENEVNFVSNNSLQKKITLASDWSTNISYTAGLKTNDQYTQLKHTKRNIKATQGKHYVALVMSDGDNLQWMENGFCSDKKYYGSKYRGSWPMTWTITPSMYDLEPGILDYLYSNATNNDYFIAGPSGVGYVNPCEYNDLNTFAGISSNYMSKTNLEYVNMLDNMIDEEKLNTIAKYDNIKGGIWSVGNYYLEGEGGVYWANNKPFVCVRESLWRNPGATSFNNYYGFVERAAQRLNSYSTDPTSIEGYSVVICHAWSIGTMDYLSRLIDDLDDHVELVTVDELLTLVKDNVKHENVDTLDDIKPTDIKDLAPIKSEQYHYEDFNNVNVDNNRNFYFDDKNLRNSYKWSYGTSGLEYDYAGIVTEGIKLDGSDLEDTLDPLPNSWAYNKFNVTEDDKYLTVFATHSSNCDANFRVRALYQEDNKLVSKVLNSSCYEKQIDSFGWYKLDNSSPMIFYYDISEFKNKTIIISLEQDDTGEGSGEVVFISRVIIGNEIDDGSNLTEWDISAISAFWNKEGSIERHAEGICLESKDARIYKEVTIGDDDLLIYMRRFERPFYEQQDPIGFVVVKFNGNVIYVDGSITEYVEVGNNEEFGYYTFDTSDYVGQTGVLEIKFVEVNNVVGKHACISLIKFN